MNKEKLNEWKDKVKKDVSCLMDAPDELLSDAEVMLDFINLNIKAFNYSDISLKSNKAFMLDIIKRDGLLLRSGHPEMLKDLDLVIPALENNGTLFKYLPVDIKVIKQVICAAISSPKGDFLLEAAGKIKDNRELMLFAVSCRGTNLMFASDRLKDDKEMVVAAINQNWLALGFASSRLKGNLEILMVAINKNGGALRFANKTLLSEKEWAKISLMANGSNLEKFPKFNEDPELTRIALENNELAYNFLSENLKRNTDFLKVAIEENYKIFFELDRNVALSEKLIITTWKSICSAYVKEHTPFLSAIMNTKVLQYWDDYKKTENPPSFSRFPDYYEKRVKREYKESKSE